MGADKNSQNDQIDQWLDGALRQYGDIEPGAGLDRRILAKLESRPPDVAIGRGWVWGVGAAVLAAACVSLAFWVASAIHPTQGLVVAVTPAPHRAELQSPRNAQSSAAVAYVVKHRTRRRPVQPEIANEPRLETFPSPRPLSEQEQLLTRYARDFPGEAAWVAAYQTKRQEELARLVADEGSRIDLHQTER
jgi:hypothetical protein